jgi:hypothetical protein
VQRAQWVQRVQRVHGVGVQRVHGVGVQRVHGVGVQRARLGRVGDAHVDRAVTRALVGAARRDPHARDHGGGARQHAYQ